MGLEVSSRYLRKADMPAKTEAGPGKPPDVSVQEQFERVMERDPSKQDMEQDARPANDRNVSSDAMPDSRKGSSDMAGSEKKTAADNMPSPSALMESLFSGRMDNVQTAPAQTQTVSGPAGSSDVGELVDKLVERILVSEPGKGSPEVRIRLGDGVLAGTELSLSRAQDGQLCVRLSCADASSFQTAVGAQDGLRVALERQGETVRLEIDQADARGGNEGDSRRRSQGLLYDVPEDV